MIKIERISKKFNKKILFDNFSYYYPNNGIYGIIGDNGSGKTTLLRLILGLDKKYNGTIKVSKNSIIYVDSKITVYPNLSILDNMMLLSNDLTKAKKLCSLFGLNLDLNKKAKKCSNGEKVRIAIIRALLANRDIILLDEPFANLDRNTLSTVKNYLIEEAKYKLIIFSTNNNFDLEGITSYINISNYNSCEKSNSSNDETYNNVNNINKKVLFKEIVPKLHYLFAIFTFTFLALFLFIIVLLGIDKKCFLNEAYGSINGYHTLIDESGIEATKYSEFDKYKDKYRNNDVIVDSKLFNNCSFNLTAEGLFYDNLYNPGYFLHVNNEMYSLNDNEIVLSDLLYDYYSYADCISDNTLLLSSGLYNIKNVITTDYKDIYKDYENKLSFIKKDQQVYAANFFLYNEYNSFYLTKEYNYAYINEATFKRMVSFEVNKSYKLDNSLATNTIIIPKKYENDVIDNKYILNINNETYSLNVDSLSDYSYFSLSEDIYSIILNNYLNNYFKTVEVFIEANSSFLNDLGNTSLVLFNYDNKLLLDNISTYNQNKNIFIYTLLFITFLILLLNFIEYLVNSIAIKKEYCLNNFNNISKKTLSYLYILKLSMFLIIIPIAFILPTYYLSSNLVVSYYTFNYFSIYNLIYLALAYVLMIISLGLVNLISLKNIKK